MAHRVEFVKWKVEQEKLGREAGKGEWLLFLLLSCTPISGIIKVVCVSSCHLVLHRFRCRSWCDMEPQSVYLPLPHLSSRETIVVVKNTTTTPN